MTSGQSTWALENGLPSGHAVRAALHVAAILDNRGSRVADARESYWHSATGGAFPPPDMRMGEQLLLDCALVERRGDVLYPTTELHELLDGSLEDAAAVVVQRSLIFSQPRWIVDSAARALQASDQVAPLISDPERREELLLALGARFDAAQREAVGEMGELAVVNYARQELTDMGHDDLARKVRRVSLESDQLGYDVVAPRVVGDKRLLEVKTSTAPPSDVTPCFLTRNEAGVGQQFANWALVFCYAGRAQDSDAEIVGWTGFESIEGLLPTDTAQGRWEVAHLAVPTGSIFPGLPLP